ncbi:MAG TPA: ECF transporter S component [Firmicutes bacterium]|nr:ECF transporter S component [Bacillota bacterium]
MRTARDLSRLALLVALGILLPLFFHLTNIPGKVFLPMHLPVLLAGFLLGPVAGLVVGLVSPLVNFVLSGMPPLSPPILPVMVIELSVYGLVAGAGVRARRVEHLFLVLALAMLAGRLAMGLAIWLVGPAFGWPFQPYPYVAGAVVTGLPGIVIQFVVIPPIVRAIRRLWGL